ncbi:hypothetical protein HPB51_006547 [Rhipicephalus microplus]|uniref:Uncharacterized protein n=1 Tax=Rhipicephalus microplus TaxID=6941 RepID=A0A9J6E694_RHIMP|nr:hypothetical protein HPB51_006547 [Rhipicephalus microplus]
MLAAVLFSALVGQHVFSASGNNKKTADSYKTSARTCRPNLKADYVGNRSICTFTRKEDSKVGRVPEKIYHLNCNCPVSRCSDRDDYRCVQVKEKMQVSFPIRNSHLVSKKYVTVNSSCVCAASKGTIAVLNDDRPLDENGNKEILKEVNGTIKIKVDETPDSL